jgi:hypothetical protein
MDLDRVNTIDDVIAILETIIIESEENNNPMGYFASLYQNVTICVKDGIANNFFDDGPRMEQLDIVFAKRYLDASFSYMNNETVSLSWKKAFDLSTNYWPIVLQHILMGINAHINLDLGTAAAEISRGKNLADMENDFNKINTILSSLVHEVESDLSVVWPALKYLLKWSGKVDDFLVDFSMKLAREGAWKYANQIINLPEQELQLSIDARDQRVADKVHIITKPGMIARAVMGIIRVTERGSVSDKINRLKKRNPIISAV